MAKANSKPEGKAVPKPNSVSPKGQKTAPQASSYNRLRKGGK